MRLMCFLMLPAAMNMICRSVLPMPPPERGQLQPALPSWTVNPMKFLKNWS